MVGFAEVVGGYCCRRSLAAAVVVAVMKSRQGVLLFQIVVVGSAVPLAGGIRRPVPGIDVKWSDMRFI